jgi:hypothetical protein
MYLARTNSITLVQSDNVNSTLTGGNPALYLGHNTQSGNTNGSVLYLGITNGLFANYIIIGRGNQTNNLLAFNPAFLTNHPIAYIRGSDGLSRIGFWSVGDNSSGSMAAPSSGTNDFTGGTVDAMVDLLFLGRGRVGTTVNTGTGTLTFNDGVMDVNTLRLGTMVDEATSTNASGVGIANVNGTATLLVNDALEFAHINTVAAAAPSAIAGMRGTLNINGGTVRAANILGAGGAGIINLNSGVLDVQGGSIVNLTDVNIGGGGSAVPALLTNCTIITALNPLVIASNGILAGNTIVTSPQLNVQGVLSPGGDLPGTMSVNGAISFGPGGRYVFDIQNAVGQPGADWDLLTATAGLDIPATPTNPFTVRIRTLDDTGFGPMLAFDNSTPQNWVIVAANALSNFSPSKFLIDSSGFQNDLGGGSFRIGTNGSSLLLSFVPQPQITGISAMAGNLSISGGNGVANRTYYVLGSTNLLSVVASWTRIATNSFDGNGNFSWSAPITAGVPQQFFAIQVP